MATEPCPYCFFDVRVTWWDQALGFAIRCPRCGASSGPPWGVNRLVLTIFASLLINGLILFLVARPVRALSLLAVYVASVAALIAACIGVENDAFTGTAMCAFLLGPACLAVIEYRWHAVALRQLPVLPRSAAEDEPAAACGETVVLPEQPRFLGIRDLERLRNEVEIAIFHKKDRIELLAKISYFAAGLQAVMAALNNAWLDVSMSLLLVGLAYTVRAHESRTFSVIYSFFGLLIAAEFVRRSAHGDDSIAFGLALFIIVLGLGFTVQSFSLHRLRRFREGIHLEPADHLRDL